MMMTDTPEDVEFWQAVADFAYRLDSEPAAYRREAIEHFLAHSPEKPAGPELFGPLENFRRYAVLRLLEVWLAGPMERETQERRARDMLQAVGAALGRGLNSDDDPIPPRAN